MVWGRFDQKWGHFGLGPFSIGAVLTGNHIIIELYLNSQCFLFKFGVCYALDCIIPIDAKPIS